jgi:hypothetical protein
MAEEQGTGTPSGRPALNFERIYGTTVSAEEVARALADHFRGQEFEAQVYRTQREPHGDAGSQGKPVAPAAGCRLRTDSSHHSRRRAAEHQPGGHEWVDAAVSGAIGLVAVPPVLLGTAYGIWKENQLDREVWQVIDKAVGASDL